jgi:flagellin-specific chaperone FliS
MTMEMMSGYRATMFDEEAGIEWLRHGWRALQLFARKAREAGNKGDAALKAQMIERANRLLNLMAGILDTGSGATLGPSLMNIYSSLSATLFRANLENGTENIDDFERAVEKLSRDMLGEAELAVVK